ncbi:hypothetical protein A3C67_01840 [Candidatus Nomurabacteria bacterium RIFCSPHIGHO2_02_FULL_42_19]|uniref:Uncharacterized protein n=1 Tax=Candidatus Nomurabacteria bacterium RIFCSPHIGHO2_02_FULL_42_19 TaxID=1801756 RepID=A0A1F6W2E2_9BACT|nr:MAG: hypothetical protein A3C67_01840 [Candidatus Nomurabacteria bacterium RIFCSPHIGHO2_02_FULL_42_19]
MTDKLKKIIQDEVGVLPKETQGAINSLDWVSIAEEIGKKNLLNESEINDLQVETLLTLVGIEEMGSYTKNIENKVGTSKDEAEKLAGELVEKIFTPIANILTENIKNNIKNKNPNWQQSVNFILSGGDYTAFIERRSDMINTTPISPLSGGTIPPRPDKGEVGRGF